MSTTRRIKIVGDGSPRGVRVLDAATGEAIHGVTRVAFTASHGGYEVALTLVEAAVDLAALGTVIERTERFARHADSTYEASEPPRGHEGGSL